MKQIRKWSRILHRDIGFFFVGTSIVFGISGIALNHMHDWNPNYTVENTQFQTEIELRKGVATETNVKQLVDDIANSKNMRKYYYPNPNRIKIFLKGGSSIIVNTQSGMGNMEKLNKRPIFYQVNFLHYNPNIWWTWFSDAFSVSLILFAITALAMVKGKRGMKGTGGLYTIIGIIIPLLFLLLS